MISSNGISLNIKLCVLLQMIVIVLSTEANHDVQFRLSNNWYGKVQVKYNGEWGQVCDTNWGNTEADIVCKQLGYKGGVAKESSQDIDQAGYYYMDNVNCTGNENSILECSHTADWTSTTQSCTSASVKCNITVCPYMDIRTSVDNLNQLRHCNVIEGDLKIILIDASWEEYKQYSFPNLVEITDNLVLFRVGGLRSLRHLFPNLAIIRGDRLFMDYALVVYEMFDLTELGLKSLVSIQRGAVRLEKNPNLCYIETIDWARIIKNFTTNNAFLRNKDVKECGNQCPDSCVRTQNIDAYGNGMSVPRCWTSDDCQAIHSCPASCKSGLCNGNVCCHPNCIGGCTGPSPNQCTACRDVMAHDKHGDTYCTQKCPYDTHEFRSRRCLLEEECVKFPYYELPRDQTCYYKLPNTWDRKNCLKLVSKSRHEPGICAEECPSGYVEDPSDKQKCLPCVGKCPKVCNAKTINSVTAAQKFAGCTIINGPLIIDKIQGEHIGLELERNLGDIEEVTGYIRVHSSYALLSLHFLRGLRTIRGDDLYNRKYLFYVFNNVNLEELFLPEVASNLSIGNGSLFFQSNNKLCYKKITDFITTIGQDGKKINNTEISKSTNGNHIPCDIQTLNISFMRVTTHIALMSWTSMPMTDSLLGYSIYWKETQEKDVSIYQGRDACSDDMWKTKDDLKLCSAEKCTSHSYLTGLRPWTQYAVYVRALTVSTAIQGAISNVYYIRTKAEVPTNPVNLQIRTERPGELKVTWDPPNHPNGNVTHYQVYWQRRINDPADYEIRNYCLNPILSSWRPWEGETEEEKKHTIITSDSCCCPESEKERISEEREKNLDTKFQDYLQNQVYVKRIAESKAKRKSSRSVAPSTDPHTKSVYDGMFIEREFIISNLGHFEDYNIEVIACHYNPDRLCSSPAVGYGRTIPDPEADNIDSSTVTWELYPNTRNAVHIQWQDPPQPNGLIVTYNIEYRNQNIQYVEPNILCITFKDYKEAGMNGYVLDKLETGSYIFRIRVSSLAGHGPWTNEMRFTIP